jgi:hypothetical protein
VAQWTVTVGDEITRSLAEDLQGGPIIDDPGRRLLEEEVVDYLGGLKIDIFADEHPPPHFRVVSEQVGHVCSLSWQFVEALPPKH